MTSLLARIDAITATIAGLLMAVAVAIAWTLYRAGSEDRP